MYGSMGASAGRRKAARQSSKRNSAHGAVRNRRDIIVVVIMSLNERVARVAVRVAFARVSALIA